MWFVVIMLASVGTGFVLGPLLARAAAEQTAEPALKPEAAFRMNATAKRLRKAASLN